MIFFDVLHELSESEKQALFGPTVPLLGRSSMDFRQLRESQVLYESNLVAKDTDLKTLNTPEYLLKRGIHDEATEALEAITVLGLGVDSDEFRNELIDIVVFLSSLFNHIEMDEAEIHQRAQQVQQPVATETPEETLSEHIIVQAEQLLTELSMLGSGSTVFRDNVIVLALTIDRLLKQAGMSQPELQHRTNYIVVKNFIKYQPGVVKQYNMADGLEVSRAAFQKKKKKSEEDSQPALQEALLV